MKHSNGLKSVVSDYEKRILYNARVVHDSDDAIELYREVIKQTCKYLIRQIRLFSKDFPFDCHCSKHKLADKCDRCKYFYGIDRLVERLQKLERGDKRRHSCQR